jgi:uncharacterized CHY-type Zn-finger protein
MDIPKNLELAKKQSEYKVYACSDCQKECVAVPLNPNEHGQPQELLVVCPTCIKGFHCTVDEYRKAMA